MKFILYTLAAAIGIILSFQIHYSLPIFLHIIPSLFFLILAIKDNEYIDFFIILGVICTLLPIINWGFLILFIFSKKMKSFFYDKHKHSFLVRLSIKNKQNL